MSTGGTGPKKFKKFTKKQKQVLDKETVFEQFTKPCLEQRFTEIVKKLNIVDIQPLDLNGSSTNTFNNDRERKRKDC